MLNKIKVVHIAWLVLIFYCLHLIEEFYGGVGLAAWLREYLGASLSERDFLIINFFGLIMFTLVALVSTFSKANGMLVGALGILVFINGIIHLAVSIYTSSYSPGTITGILLYFPIGFLVYRNIWPDLKIEDRIGAVSIAVVIQSTVYAISMSI